MTPRPLIPRLDPKVISLDEERAWREFQMAVRALEALAEQADRRDCDSEPQENG